MRMKDINQVFWMIIFSLNENRFCREMWPQVTASGVTLTSTVSESGITFTNEAGVVSKDIFADIVADNGVAHTIDTVL